MAKVFKYLFKLAFILQLRCKHCFHPASSFNFGLAADLEVGLELSQVGAIDDDRYVGVDSKCTSATDTHMDGRLAPPFKTTSDIGGASGC